MTTDNLHTVLSWIDKIKLVPLDVIGQLNLFANFTECTFKNLKNVNLQNLPFNKDENI